MARKASKPEPTIRKQLKPQRRYCPTCGRRMWIHHDNRRVVVTLDEVVELTLKVRWCVNASCEGYHRPYRPESEGRWALPEHEFGLDVIAAVGSWRYREHRSVPEMHQRLRDRGVAISERSVTNLLHRYDELMALSVLDMERLRRITGEQGRVILALDGLQPDVGHEVLWVLRDCLSGQVLLTASLLSARQSDLAGLIEQVRDALDVPIAGVISDGQRSIRKAVAATLAGAPHQLCQFHYLREAARPIYEADRHAKKLLKKQVRGIRPIERELEGRRDAQAQAVRGYCAAVRSAITDDARPPLVASGLKLHDRLSRIDASLDRVAKKGDRHF
jgi:hypothetical protein